MHAWGDVLPAHHPGQVPDGKSVHKENAVGQNAGAGSFCECGAWSGCLGLEPTPELYVRHLVEVLRELKRVLRADGVLWLNLGDSYASTPPGNKNRGLEKWATSGLHGAKISAKYAETLDRSAGQKRNTIAGDLKPKGLVGIPWMVAFALRADGWYLRSDIIWSKPNPMPESVTDRPTKSHEYIFLLSKSERYYYDQAAIKEPYTESSLERYEYSAIGKSGKTSGPNYVIKSNESINALGVTRSTAALKSHEHNVHPNGRNKRTVWTITTQPYSGAHFATFPPELIKPCILAGAPLGGVVLDPFAGSGTTAKVSIELGRKAIAIEPKAEYVEMIKKRCQTTIGLPLAI